MPDISIQQAYALAFGAYASPAGNSSFTIQGSNGLPTNKTRLTGLLTTPNIDLNPIPSEQNEAPFNPGLATFTLANSLNTVTEFASGGTTIQLATAGANSTSGIENSSLFIVFPEDTVSGALNFSQSVFIVSSASGVTPTVFPASSNITVAPVQSSINIARLRKTSQGTIGIAIRIAYDGDPNFFAPNILNNAGLFSGLEFIIAGAQGTPFSGFNTVSPNPNKFIPPSNIFYDTADVDPWFNNVSYQIGEFVRFAGASYFCIQNTTAGLDQDPNDSDFWEPEDPLQFGKFGSFEGTYAATAFTINTIPCVEFQFPSGSYASTRLGASGRYESNPGWMPNWISIGTSQTLVDEVTGGGASGNQCGTVTIQPLNNAYAKQSTWLLKLSQTLPPNGTFTGPGGALTSFQAVQGSSFAFSIVASGSTPIPRLVYNFGGDINSSANLTATEKNYHRVGIGIVNKLKK
jgi:hypothetical protein